MNTKPVQVKEKTNRKTVMPAVHILPGKGWTVKEGLGKIDITAKEIIVPLDPLDHSVRTHEIVHGLESPPREAVSTNNILHNVMSATEDYRVNRIMQDAGCLPDESPFHVLATAKMMTLEDEYLQASIAFSTGNDELMDKLGPKFKNPDLLKKCRTILKKHIDPDPYDFKRTESAARSISRLFRKMNRENQGKGKDQKGNGAGEGQGQGQESKQEYKRLSKTSEAMYEAIKQEIMKELTKTGDMPPAPGIKGDDNIGWKPSYFDLDAQWGDLKVKNVPLDKISNQKAVKFLARQYYYTDKGYIPRRVDRMLYGRTIFGEKKQVIGKKPVVVVIDCSGSMDSRYMVRESIKIAKTYSGPLVIYCYGGDDSTNGTWGIIQCIARNGRYTDNLKLPGENIVDLPALAYALKNNPDHVLIWVSDGGWTGTYCRRSTKMENQFKAFIEANKVLQVRYINDILPLIKTLNRIGLHRTFKVSGAATGHRD